MNKLEEYLKNPNICLCCNKPILPKENQTIYSVMAKKFCNASCAASYNNRLRNTQEHVCKNCGKALNKKGIYCNHTCQQEYQYKQYITKWKDGKENGLKGEYQLSGHIKRYIFEKYDSKCAICGWDKINPYTNNIPLEIEHIDGDYSNNEESNLTLLCPNCHSLTATYKGANKGNGRKQRKKYSESM